MTPLEASMEKFPHKWWLLLHPNIKVLPTCWRLVNQVLGPSLLPHKPAVRTSEMALAATCPRAHPHGPAPAHTARPLGKRWEPGLLAIPNPSRPSVSPSRTPSASLTPTLRY